MALLNPVYAFFVPFLFVVTIPLALFAGITTLLAFSVLIFRVALVYLDIAISLVPQSIVGFKPRRYRPPRQRLQLQPRAQQQQHRLNIPRLSPTSTTIHSATPSPTLTPGRRRRRRPSSASIISNGSTTPVGDGSLGLMPSVGPERDYEGIGGWRVGDDDIWTTINSRLEFPDRRHHHRSASGGAVTTPGEGSYLMMKGRTRSPEARASKPAISPNSSRARTPTGARISFAAVGGSDGYFPLTLSPKALKKQPHVANE
ncbi:hypothetical protein HJFPF1_03315 [Paramyrothecium foliicola]|nr:hypothetical protein HJFPF1_03315 [Paramyrothecium foliicola]